MFSFFGILRNLHKPHGAAVAGEALAALAAAPVLTTLAFALGMLLAGAGAASAQRAPGPPGQGAGAGAGAGAISIRIEPAALVLGSAAGRVTVSGASAGTGAAAERFHATLGTVDGGRYAVPERRAPGWAIVAVQADTGSASDGDADVTRAAIIVPLIGAGALPTQTKPGAQVTVEIEGRSFGPVTANAEGEVAVPVEVQPQARLARVHAIDTNGLSTTREVTLPDTDYPRALVLAPAALAAGESGVVTVFAISGTGTWRDATARAPTLDLPPGLEQAGAARARAPGRWDIPVRARDDVASAAAATLGALVDGTPAIAATISLRARPPRPPAPPAPVPSARGPRRDLALRAGLAVAGNGLSSWALAAELGWPLRARRTPGLHLVASAQLAHGETATFTGTDVPKAEIAQLDLAIGLRLRFPLTLRLRLEAGAGAGWAFADATLRSPNTPTSKNTSTNAPLLYAGTALVLRLGPGEVLLDARWIDVRFASAARVDGAALGLVATLGYRILL